MTRDSLPRAEVDAIDLDKYVAILQGPGQRTLPRPPSQCKNGADAVDCPALESATLAVLVHIPQTMRDYCGCKGELSVSAGSVADGLRELQRAHSQVYRCVCDETGAVRKHIHLFVNNDFVPVRDPRGLEVRLESGDILTIWTAVSGG